MDEPDPIDFSKDLSSKKSEIVIVLITLAVLGTKAVPVIPVMLVQLRSFISLGPSGNFLALLAPLRMEEKHVPLSLINPSVP